jgi:hypothetical protein
MEENALHSRSDFPKSFDLFFFKKVWFVVQNNLKFFFQIVFFTALAAILLNYIAALFFESIHPAEQIESGTEDPSVIFSYVVLQFSRLLIVLIPKVFFMVVFISVLPKIYENEHIRLADVVNLGFTKLLPLYIYSAIILALVFLGVMMLIIPGIIILVQFTFLQFVIVLEGDAADSNAAIISRSFQLVSGIQWKIFLIYLVKFGVLMIMLVPAIMQVAAGGPDIDATGIQESDVNYISGFLQEFVLEWTTYIITALFFQLYMITRIEKKEIEIIRE